MTNQQLTERCEMQIVQNMAKVPLGTRLNGQEAVEYVARYVANTVTTLVGSALAEALLAEVTNALAADKRATTRARDAGKVITPPREGAVRSKRGRF